MHDTLPLMLFGIESLVKLLMINPLPKNEIAYFIPWTFLIIGLQDGFIDREQRIDYLEISFYYVLLYYPSLKIHQLPKGLTREK